MRPPRSSRGDRALAGAEQEHRDLGLRLCEAGELADQRGTLRRAADAHAGWHWSSASGINTAYPRATHRARVRTTKLLSCRTSPSSSRPTSPAPPAQITSVARGWAGAAYSTRWVTWPASGRSTLRSPGTLIVTAASANCASADCEICPCGRVQRHGGHRGHNPGKRNQVFLHPDGASVPKVAPLYDRKFGGRTQII